MSSIQSSNSPRSVSSVDSQSSSISNNSAGKMGPRTVTQKSGDTEGDLLKFLDKAGMVPAGSQGQVNAINRSGKYHLRNTARQTDVESGLYGNPKIDKEFLMDYGILERDTDFCERYQSDIDKIFG